MNTIAFTSVQEWKFSRPLYFGDTVFVETNCLKKETTSRRTGTILWHRKLINQSNLIAQEGIFETLVAMANPLPRAHFDAQSQATQSARSGSGGSNRPSPEKNLGPLESRSSY
jgi:acyl-CoA hydrolase